MLYFVHDVFYNLMLHISLEINLSIYIYIYSYKVEIGIYGLHGVCVMWIDLICLSLSSRKLNYYKG